MTVSLPIWSFVMYSIAIAVLMALFMSSRWVSRATKAEHFIFLAIHDWQCGREIMSSLYYARDALRRTGDDETLSDTQYGMPTHKHEGTGGMYVRLGEFELKNTPGSDGTIITAYRNTNSGEGWAQPWERFNDGRFKALGKTHE